MKKGIKASDRKNKKENGSIKHELCAKEQILKCIRFFLLIYQNDTNLRIMYIKMQVGLSECHQQKKITDFILFFSGFVFIFDVLQI